MEIRKTDKIYIAGHTGLVGSAILNSLISKGYTNLVYKTHEELDLCDINQVKKFFDNENPDIVILAAAKVGGIVANNTYRADFIYNNLLIELNVIGESFKHNVKKLLFLGSTCIYPKFANQPINENELLTNELEYTNEPYAIAKIAGLKLCESFNIQYNTNFISVMPTNLYGPNDNFNLEKGHVLPVMIRKIHLANCLYNEDWELIRKDLNKRPIENINGNSNQLDIINVLEKYGIYNNEVILFGDGSPLREFLWSEDLADAVTYILEHINFKDTFNTNDEIKNCHINISSGKEISIKQLSLLISNVLNYIGNIKWDINKPNGTPRKLCDVSKLNNLGWKHKVELNDGIKYLYKWYIDNLEEN